MEYIEAYSLYKLRRLETTELVSLADEWLSTGVYTEALDELYTQQTRCMADVGPLFERAMSELGVEGPSVMESANNIVRITLRKIIEEKVDPVEGAGFLYYKVYREIVEEFPNKEIAGDQLSLQDIFRWLYEIEDCDCRDDSIVKFKGHLIEEAAKWLNIAT